MELPALAVPLANQDIPNGNSHARLPTAFLVLTSACDVWTLSVCTFTVFGACSELTRIDLSNTWTTAVSLPTSLFNLTTLRYVNLGTNTFTPTVPIPDTLSALSGVTYLDMRACQLTTACIVPVHDVATFAVYEFEYD